MSSTYGPGDLLELSSSCSHYVCNDCDIAYDEDLACETCAGPVVEYFGWCTCWDDNAAAIVDMSGQWYETHGGEGCASVFVVGMGIGWTNSAGRFSLDIGDIISAFTLNGDYRLEFAWTDYGLTVRRWSHDEPTGGARFLCESVANELRAVEYV